MRDRVVLITGVGGRGQVGYAVAGAVLRAGARVLITAREGARVREHAAVLAALGPAGAVAAVGADLAGEEGARAAVAAVLEAHGRLDGVVNAVGGLHVIAPLGETDPPAWERELKSNVWTVYHVCRAALGPLRESRGAIVNFASRTPFHPAKNLGAYSVGKAGVIALTRTLALEELEYGVRVNAIAPGMMDTEQNRREARDAAAVAWVALDEVAATALFLLSDAASAITGQVIELTGHRRGGG
ncbi:MAG: SDR family oxidoreductase [Gemmatimonadetes bacterium]|nr:SDR family oxidoreductase [Gemmatimonadota bacterium]